MFSAMDRKNLNFWGIVDSHLIKWHLMSWFWVFDRNLTQSGWIDWYLREFDLAYTKWDQIRNFEMRLPMLLKREGYAVGSYIAADDVFNYVLSRTHDQRASSLRRDFTMTHECWDIIIEKFRCPALKVELLRDNPLGMELGHALEFIQRNTSYDVELIRRHIRRIKTAHLMKLSSSAQHEAGLDSGSPRHLQFEE
jgi:rhamnosyltransferase